MTETQRTAVIFGLANKRSIAWAIAQKLNEAGARCLRRGGCRQHVLGMQFDVIVTDASARTAALNVVDVHSDFTRQATHAWRSRDRIAMLRPSHFAQLVGHCE